MAQHPIELILAQRLASHLAMPVFLVGADGALLYYNDAAEAIFGYRFDETGSVPMEVWATVLAPADPDGTPLPADEMPVVRALRTRQPIQGALRIRGLDGVDREITGTVLPLEGQGGRHVGALAVFWEASA